MSKNKFLFILAAASLLSLGSCGPVEAKSSTTASSAPAESSSTAPASSSTKPGSSSSAPTSSSSGTASSSAASSSSSSSSASSSSSEEESQNGLIYTLSEDKASYSVTGYDNSAADVTIPNTHKGLPVTAIGDKAFKNSNVIQVVMPDNVTAIGQYAFNHCKKLVSVTFSQRLISIGSYAFFSSAITSLSLPESLKEVGMGAFLSCSSLAYTTDNQLRYLPSGTNDYFLLADSASSSLITVTIRPETKVVEDGAFFIYTGPKSFAVDSSNPNFSTDGKALFNKDKTALVAYARGAGVSYSVPATVTKIGNCAFLCCSALTSVTFGNSLTSIGVGAFTYCGLTSIALPASLTSIGEGAFADCGALASFAVDSANANFETDGKALYNKGKTELLQYAIGLKDTAYALPDSLLRIDGQAFAAAENLTGITLPASLTSIGAGAFAYCNALASIALPSSLTSIGDQAFDWCKALASIALPSSLTSIGEGAFAECGALASFAVDAANANFETDGKALYDKGKTELLQYALGLKDTTYSFPDSLLRIDGDAFSRANALTGITLPASLTSIGDCAFQCCSTLASVTFGNSLTSIGDQAFEVCTSLASVTFGNSLTSIGEYAFHGCTSLASIALPSSLTGIGDEAFADCSLTSIALPSSLTSIGYEAFEGCKALASITADSANPAYAADGKALYDKGKTELLQYALGRMLKRYPCLR